MKLNVRTLALLAAGLSFPLMALAAPEAKTEAKPETKPAPTAEKAAEKPAEKAAEKPAEKKGDVPVVKSDTGPVVLVKTSMGDIRLRLNREKAPVSVENFIKYANDKAYDGTIFHRVIEGFMIQGGGFTPDMIQRKTNAPIKLESQNGLPNKRGSIAMARTNVPDSATSQFFINLVDNANLNYAPGPGREGYAVFGEVIEGMDVVDKIKAVKTTSKPPHANVPVEPVMIESVRVVTP